MKNLLTKLLTRTCRGCRDASFHTAHLTWIGRLRYTGSIRRSPISKTGDERG